jgi:hypothetical protein
MLKYGRGMVWAILDKIATQAKSPAKARKYGSETASMAPRMSAAWIDRV